MKIAVLSDIHGNYAALQECIKYVLNRGVDAFVFLKIMSGSWRIRGKRWTYCVVCHEVLK